MTTLALLFLRTLSAIFYTFFVIILPLAGFYKIQEDFRQNLFEGLIMISIGGGFFFLSLRYVKRKMIGDRPYYKEYGKSAKRKYFQGTTVRKEKQTS